MSGRVRWLAVLLGICMILVGAASAAGSRLSSVSSVLAYSTSYDIWLTDLARGIFRQLTRDGSRFLDDSPSWSPDGAQIAFTTVRSFPYNPNLPNGEIAVVGIDGAGFRFLTRERSWDDDPAWSPDGRTIAFRSDRDSESGSAVYLIDLAAPTEPPRMVIQDRLRSDLAPSWSLDSANLLLHATHNGAPQVVSVNIVSGTVQLILARAAYDPRVSPDGLHIAMWMPAFEGYSLSIGSIGESPRPRTQTHMNPAPYSWSPDGALIAFASTEGGRSVVRLLDTVTGTTSIAFYSPSRVSGIAWRP